MCQKHCQCVVCIFAVVCCNRLILVSEVAAKSSAVECFTVHRLRSTAGRWRRYCCDGDVSNQRRRVTCCHVQELRMTGMIDYVHYATPHSKIGGRPIRGGSKNGGRVMSSFFWTFGKQRQDRQKMQESTNTNLRTNMPYSQDE